jgi:hypothetical protein
MEEHLLAVVRGLDEAEPVLERCNEPEQDSARGSAAVASAVRQAVLDGHRHRHQLLGSLHLETIYTSKGSQPSPIQA